MLLLFSDTITFCVDLGRYFAMSVTSKQVSCEKMNPCLFKTILSRIRSKILSMSSFFTFIESLVKIVIVYINDINDNRAPL